jgi:hypothetical protein
MTDRPITLCTHIRRRREWNRTYASHLTESGAIKHICFPCTFTAPL